MGDLKNPKLIYAKGLLFLIGGVLAAGLILAEQPSLRILFLLVVSIWCFARAYYFAFYVVERYVTGNPPADGEIRLSGLIDGLRVAFARRSAFKQKDGQVPLNRVERSDRQSGQQEL